MMRARALFLGLIFLAGCGVRPAPLPSPASEPVEFTSGKEKGRGVLFRPAGPGPFPGVLLLHGDFGLDEPTKRQAEDLARKGYLVLAVDLYRGEKVDNTLDAHIMDRGLEQEQVLGDLRGAVDWLQQQPSVQAERVGVVGVDMGGGYALDLGVADRRVKAVVTGYGKLVTEPDTLSGLEAPVLGIFAANDVGTPPETLQAFRAAMDKAGKHLVDLVVYPECDRGFLTEPRSEKEKEACAKAWERIETFLRAELHHQR